MLTRLCLLVQGISVSRSRITWRRLADREWNWTLGCPFIPDPRYSLYRRGVLFDRKSTL